MPRNVCSSSTTTTRKRMKNVAQRAWCGRSAQCSISGFVSTTFAERRTQVRSSGLQSPSYAPATTPGRPSSARALSWSCASALVGNSRSDVPGRVVSAAASAIGTW
jgi:hypothetical protein